MQASLREKADDEYKRILRQSAQEDAQKKEKEAFDKALRESRKGLPSPTKDSDFELALALSLGSSPPKSPPPSSASTQANPKPKVDSPQSDQDEDEQLKRALEMSLQKKTDSWS